MSAFIQVDVDINTGVSLMNRIEGKILSVTAPLTQASLTKISVVTTYKPTGANVVNGTLDLVIADVIFDTLQVTDWEADEIGYNFRWDVPDDIVTETGTYFAIITFTPVTGTEFKVKYCLNGKGDTK